MGQTCTYTDNVDPLLKEFDTKRAAIIRVITDGPTCDLRDLVTEDLDHNRLIFGSPKLPNDVTDESTSGIRRDRLSLRDSIQVHPA